MGVSRGALLALLAIPLIIAASNALSEGTQGHWSDRGGLAGSATIGAPDPRISSWKLLGCCHCHANVTVEGSMVTLELGGCGSCHNASRSLWLGLVVSNEGSVPAVLVGAGVESNATVSHEAYLYGPVHSPGDSGYWGHVRPCDLPFPGNVSRVLVYQSGKAIAWIHLEVEGPAVVTVTLSYDAYEP